MAASLPRLFVLGDSISIQYGPYLEKEVAGVFAYDRKRADDGRRAEDDLDFPQGGNGGDSAMCLAFLRHRRQHDPIPADILLLNCGLHDIKTDPVTHAIQVPADRYEQNLRDILAEAAAMKLKVVWVCTTPVIDAIHNAKSKDFHRHAADLAKCNAIADKVMAAAGVPMIDLYGFCEPLVPAAFIDHVHYSEDVRAKQAGFIARELRKLG